jgi:hypothetical protein
MSRRSEEHKAESDADRLLEDCRPAVRSIAEALSRHLTEEHGCVSYVKTIYIGFERDGQIVAALYPHATSVELAMALPEDSPHPQLIDATHLTWRTMPVALVVTSETEIPIAKDLLDEAVDGVVSGTHDVELSIETFMGRSRHIANRRIVGR